MEPSVHVLLRQIYNRGMHNYNPGIVKIRCGDGLPAYAFFLDGALTRGRWSTTASAAKMWPHY
jgi:hypothetical protein